MGSPRCAGQEPGNPDEADRPRRPGSRHRRTGHADKIGTLGGYANSVKGSNGGPFKIKSGLTTLTNHRILATDFAPFKKATDADRWAAKGVLFTRVQVPGVGPVDLYNTHCQANDGNEAYRLHNNEVLGALMRRHEAGNPTFVMGDFNYTPSAKEYQNLVQGLGLRDAFTEANPKDPGYTYSPENSNIKAKETPTRLDYIFVTGGTRFDVDVSKASRAMTQTFDGKHASDHFAIHGQFVLRPKAAARPYGVSSVLQGGA